MIPLRALGVVLVFVLSACGGTPDPVGPDPADAPVDPKQVTAVIDYEGPAIDAAFEDSEGGDPHHSVRVAAMTPTAGWRFDVEDVATDVGRAIVTLRLTEPAADVLVAQVVTTLTVQAKLSGPATTVEIRVARWRDGVEYFAPPAARLAKVLTH